ncbi:MAG: hypothetical protein HYU43_03620, partial [Armatimonadetes bacterium]|nr:hypothetical protein [Armatimonadota bacterium]
MNRSLIMLSVLVLPSGTGTSEGVYWSPVVYPAAGNIRAEAGTVEIWFRLDTNPLPGCYFSLVQLHYPADAATVLSFSYGDHMGNVVFRVAGAGRFFGMPVGSTYLTSALRGMTVKAPEPYPRHVSLAAKEWHYVALTWECPQPQTFRAYLDGKPIIPGGKVRGLVWHDLKQGRLQGPGGILTVDELRISSVCRPPEEIQRYYESVESRDTAPKLEVPED